MYWTRDDTEIDRCVARLREDQRELVRISEDAAAVIVRCNRLLEEDAAEIAQLLHDRSA